MTDEEWTDVEVAPGNYVRWNEIGDQVTGWVVSYDPSAGSTDFDGNECGLLVIDDHETRELRSITLDKGALKTAVAAASPRPGLLIRITHDGKAKSKTSAYEYKTFAVQVSASSKAPERPSYGDETPF